MASWIFALLMCAVTSAGSDCTILHFTADWCQPCREIDPSLAKLQQAGWTVREIDSDQQPQWVAHFRVENLPTLVILSGDREADRIVGAASFETIQARVERVAARGRTSPSASGPRDANPALSIPDRHDPSANHGAAAAGAGHAAGGPIVRGQSPTMGAFPLLASATRPALTNVNAARLSPAATTSLTPEQAVARAAAATVRIRVEEANTTAFGTGTIIDVHGQEALVLTCGHLFRNMTPGSQLTVDLFATAGQPLKLPAQLIDFKAEGEDVGLISFHLPLAVEPVEVLPRGHKPTIGDEAFSLGCDHGADPTLHNTKIKNIDRYIGAANIEIYGAPAVGRSGGGLFDMQGRLLGVCNAADATDDEGIYAAADVVYSQIERLGLTHLLADQVGAGQLASQGPLTLPAGESIQAVRAQEQPQDGSAFNNNAEASLGVAAIASRSERGNVRDQGGYDRAASGDTRGAMTDIQWPDDAELERALAAAPADPVASDSARGTQVICIVRDAHGRDRLVTIDAPSPQLLQTIEQYARP